MIPPIPTEPVSPKPVARPYAPAAVVYSPAVNLVWVYVLHLREVEQDSPVVGAVTCKAVAAAADGELQPALARQRDDLRDVGRVLSSDDERWVAVESTVEDGACLVVGGVLGAYELAADV